jgi:adenylosuccinate synthase
MEADVLARCTPRYLEVPGWSESTLGVTDLEALPANARSYLETLERLSGLPIDLISTGPDRNQTLVRRHPFGG